MSLGGPTPLASGDGSVAGEAPPLCVEGGGDLQQAVVLREERCEGAE